VALGLLAANRQSLTDWWRLRSYQAPAAVSQLAAQVTMTDYARKVFYVNQPAVADKPSFAQACAAAGSQKEKTIVLGCYHSGQNGIYVLNVDDPRLQGVEQVTAAHEMLHAAYDRLGRDERAKVDAMLKDYYDHQLSDQRIVDTMAAYKKTEPNDLVNEMHSIFGTEIANLPAPLEAYYKQYFNNRSQVAAYAAQYQAAFTSRQALLAQYEARLDTLKRQIETAEIDLRAQQAEISARQAALTAERSSGNLAAYNAGVPEYNRLVDAYNNQLAAVKALIDQFNQLVATHNALVLEQNQLRDELNATAAPLKQ
jgi:hypothetical protein